MDESFEHDRKRSRGGLNVVSHYDDADVSFHSENKMFLTQFWFLCKRIWHMQLNSFFFKMKIKSGFKITFAMHLSLNLFGTDWEFYFLKLLLNVKFVLYQY